MESRKKLLLIALLLSTVNVWAQSKEVTKIPEYPTSSDSIEFYGKVKSVQETSFNVVEKFGKVQKGAKYSIEYICDNKRNLVEYNYRFAAD